MWPTNKIRCESGGILFSFLISVLDERNENSLGRIKCQTHLKQVREYFFKQYVVEFTIVAGQNIVCSNSTSEDLF